MPWEGISFICSLDMNLSFIFDNPLSLFCDTVHIEGRFYERGKVSPTGNIWESFYYFIDDNPQQRHTPQGRPPPYPPNSHLLTPTGKQATPDLAHAYRVEIT